MSSLFGVLNQSSNSLQLIQSQLGVVAENVSRAEDPNRTRHSLEQTVDNNGRATVAQFKRQVDVALRVQLEQTLSEESGSATLATYLKRVTDAFGTTAGKPPLVDSLEKFQAAWVELSATPESEVAQGQILVQGEDVAREVRRLNDEIVNIGKQIETDIEAAVHQLNEALKGIDQINTDILSTKGAGDPTMNLEDRRDQLVREVASLISVRTVERVDGKLSIFTSGGVSLVDAAPVKFTFEAGELRSSASDVAVTGQIRDGKLGVLLGFLADGTRQNPPQPASVLPGSELLRKLRSQVEGIADSFLVPTKPGEPTSFADAYDGGQPILPGELPDRFFLGDGAGSIRVNDALLNGRVRIKESAIAAVATSLTVTGRSFSADGATARDVSYVGIVTTVITTFSANSKLAQEQSVIATDFKEQLETRYQNNTGVNMDEEIALLQVLQRNYSAAARVLQTVNNMLDAIEGIIR
jgi:flagellar hook-associated protein 1